MKRALFEENIRLVDQDDSLPSSRHFEDAFECQIQAVSVRS